MFFCTSAYFAIIYEFSLLMSVIYSFTRYESIQWVKKLSFSYLLYIHGLRELSNVILLPLWFGYAQVVTVRLCLVLESSRSSSRTLEYPLCLITCLALWQKWLEVPVQPGCWDSWDCLSPHSLRTSFFFVGSARFLQLGS